MGNIPIGPPSNVIRIWRVPLAGDDAAIQRMEGCLSSDERDRAQRFRFARDYRRFVIRRAALRDIVAAQLGVRPAEVVFVYGPYGKPELHAALSPGVSFNTSHSGDLAVVALTLERAVGVDIERMKPLADRRALARRFFSQAEQVALSQLPARRQAEGFFHCWTRKEAFVKASGEGLTRSLDSFAVSVEPGSDVQLLMSVNPSDCARWSLRAFSPAPGYAGAIAADGGAWTLELWSWRPDGLYRHDLP